MLTLPHPSPNHSAAGSHAPSANELHTPSALDVRPAYTSRLAEEAQIRRQIDRAVSLALFDQSFADQLLAKPMLAVDDNLRRDQGRYLALRQIRARDLQDFARQAFDQFWGLSHPTSTRRLAGNDTVAAETKTSRTTRLAARLTANNRVNIKPLPTEVTGLSAAVPAYCPALRCG